MTYCEERCRLVVFGYLKEVTEKKWEGGTPLFGLCIHASGVRWPQVVYYTAPSQYTYVVRPRNNNRLAIRILHTFRICHSSSVIVSSHRTRICRY